MTTLKKDKIALITATVLIATILLCYAGYVMSKPVHTSGNIKHFGVETDVDFVDWGLVNVGGTSLRVVKVTNIGNVHATLSFAYYNWTPPIAETFLTVTTNYTAGTILDGKATLPIAFTLHVAPSTAGFESFTFSMNITATETP